MMAKIDRQIDAAAIDWHASPPLFITANSGGDNYEVSIKVHSRAELHEAHRIVLDAFAKSRLITAEPELLAALRECILQIDFLERFPGASGAKSVIAKARAAISKAGGQ